ncbi:MAG: hypothetical protein HUJ27_14890 [Rhodobacteraceae bacterium]|nr:hypothetical protein [Paracoccaceae bacterium]
MPDIDQLIERICHSRDEDAAIARTQLKSILGERFPEVMLEAYGKCSRATGRDFIVSSCIAFARKSEDAKLLGLKALKDRSKFVRLSAAGLLAYSLDRNMLEALKNALPGKTDMDKKYLLSAIYAIEEQNHHFFLDPDRTGKVIWNVE